jgi:hypothetical protein
MPERDELRTATLWCADCEDEFPEKAVFTGKAWFKVHTVDEQGVPNNVTFAASPCPNNPTHRRVGDVEEKPG